MRLRFEKVSDVANRYCHLDVFVGDETTPILDVSIDDDQSIRFNIYSSCGVIVLTRDEWTAILQRADAFAKLEILNEESFRKFE